MAITNNNHPPFAPYLLDRDFTVSTPHHVWTGDITYIEAEVGKITILNGKSTRLEISILGKLIEFNSWQCSANYANPSTRAALPFMIPGITSSLNPTPLAASIHFAG